MFKDARNIYLPSPDLLDMVRRQQVPSSQPTMSPDTLPVWCSNGRLFLLSS